MPTYIRQPHSDELEISFEKKPAEEVRKQLKQAGFLWAPKRLLWHAKETPERFALMQRLCVQTESASEVRALPNADLKESCGLRLTVQEVLHADSEMQGAWVQQLKEFVDCRLAEDNVAHSHPAVGCLQEKVWWDCLQFIQRNLRGLTPEQQQFELIFEYTLPGSGYKRPDVILLTGQKVVVLEFKMMRAPTVNEHKDDILQLIGYREWLKNHHSITKEYGMAVTGYLVCTHDQAKSQTMRSVEILNGHTFFEAIVKEIGCEVPCFFSQEWLDSPRTEMPDMLKAVRQLYGENRLPFLSYVNQACIEKVNTYITQAKQQRKKMLILIAGVPGAGKTAVGQSVVFEQNRTEEAQAVYLSGNGPLVEVLQDEINTAVGNPQAGENVIQSMKGFKATYFYGKSKGPQQWIFVFDEAQRAWDEGKMGRFSEPEGLLQVGERIFQQRGCAVVIGLYGNGQFIYEGEEKGTQLWERAVQEHQGWTVIAPEQITMDAGKNNVQVQDHDLFLPISLRADFVNCSPWVEAVITRAHREENEARARLAALQETPLGIFLTRDFQRIRAYTKRLDREHSDWNYGLLLSNFARPTVLTARKAGWELGFQRRENNTVKNGAYAAWYRGACKTLKQACAVFGNQGLELDCPIVLFGGDYYLRNRNWVIDVYGRERLEQRYEDLDTIVENNYRVLLTRARKQMVIFIPDIPQMDETYRYFLDMGMDLL